jgi:hypothetical protein
MVACHRSRTCGAADLGVTSQIGGVMESMPTHIVIKIRENIQAGGHILPDAGRLSPQCLVGVIPTTGGAMKPEVEPVGGDLAGMRRDQIMDTQGGIGVSQ